MLKAGGNAVDAAVAAAFTEGVVEPLHNGVAGYGRCKVIWLAQRSRAVGIDYNSVAPGGVAGLCLALRRFGTMPLPEILKPAIAAARYRFVPGRRNRRGLSEQATRMRQEFPETARVFLKDGRVPRTGERLTDQPASSPGSPGAPHLLSNYVRRTAVIRRVY